MVIEITWPASDTKQTRSNVEMDRIVHIVEGEEGFRYVELPQIGLRRGLADLDPSHHR